MTPEQIIDYLALVGDTSDNIPGVPGVGPKTAAKWLQQYRDLDTLKARAARSAGKIGERLRESLAVLDLSKQLATIRCDVDAAARASRTSRCARPTTRGSARLFERLEFSAVAAPRARRRRAARRTAPAAAAAEHRSVGTRRAPLTREQRPLRDRGDLGRSSSAGATRIAAAPLVALDTETTSLAYMRAELVGISLAVTPGEAAYIPLAHRYPGAPDQLDRAAVLARLKPWLESAAPKVGHHLKYDAHIFANHGVTLGGIEHDTMLESYVLNSTATRHDMDSVAALYLGVATIKYEDVVGKGAKQITFDQVDLDTATRYAAEDADVALRLHETLVAAAHAPCRSSRASTPTSSGRSCACSSAWSTRA